RVRRNIGRDQVRRFRRSRCPDSSSGLFCMPESNDKRPVIALTMGDPAGIGPEIVLQAVADPELAPLARWIVVGDVAVLEKASQVTGIPLQGELHDARALTGIDEFRFGRLDARCGVAAVEYVRIGTEMCLAGEAEAIVTAPLNKEAVTLSGRPFTGHTE